MPSAHHRPARRRDLSGPQLSSGGAPPCAVRVLHVDRRALAPGAPARDRALDDVEVPRPGNGSEVDRLDDQAEVVDDGPRAVAPEDVDDRLPVHTYRGKRGVALPPLVIPEHLEVEPVPGTTSPNGPRPRLRARRGPWPPRGASDHSTQPDTALCHLTEVENRVVGRQGGPLGRRSCSPCWLSLPTGAVVAARADPRRRRPRLAPWRRRARHRPAPPVRPRPVDRRPPAGRRRSPATNLTVHVPAGWIAEGSLSFGPVPRPPGTAVVAVEVLFGFTAAIDSLKPVACEAMATVNLPVPTSVTVVETGFRPVGDRTAEYRNWSVACPAGRWRATGHGCCRSRGSPSTSGAA